MKQNYKIVLGISDAILPSKLSCKIYVSKETIIVKYGDKIMAKAWIGHLSDIRKVSVKQIDVNFFCGSHDPKDTYAYEQFTCKLNEPLNYNSEFDFIFMNDIDSDITEININDKKFSFNNTDLLTQDAKYPKIDKFFITLNMERPI